MEFAGLLFVGVVIFLIVRAVRLNSKWINPTGNFDPSWALILDNKVTFYRSLSKEEKSLFEFKVQEFLLNCRVTGIKVEVTLEDKLLVASSAIIPIFQFPKWRYSNIFEVLLYPQMFNEQFKTTGPGRNILGMVGTGYMEGKMILSKKALQLGFSNESDKKNTAVHEFIHLVDKADGQIDGIPELLLKNQYTIPWLDLIQKKIAEIYKNKSDINPYGATNKAEFFAVASEYFFERPKLLSKKHPELYRTLEKIFSHKMSARNLQKRRVITERNSPCPCGSGEKFKNCCNRK